MNILDTIEQACRENNHESVNRALEAITSGNEKREAFLKIIDYYETEEARFPVGYAVLYIKWLLQNRIMYEACACIEKLSCLGIADERISELMYEHVIKPDEAEYEERFNRNLEMLRKNRVLFSGHTFDFHEVKKKIAVIKNCRPYPDTFSDLLNQEKTSFMLVDLMDMKMIQRMLEAGNYLYLVYDDMDRFCYMLLFEDLRAIRKNIEAIPTDAEENVIFFAGRDMDRMRAFFANMLTVIPGYVVRAGDNDYLDLVNEAGTQREQRVLSYTEELKAYYRDRGYASYRTLFAQRAEDIRILVIATLKTTMNQYIAKSWHNAFAELGYATRMIIENEQYERMQNNYMLQQICEYKPDMVFHTNFTINELTGEREIKDSLLWIMRHRDYTYINYGDFQYKSENMFVLPILREFIDVLRERNIPEKRICYTVEGIDIHVFTRSETVNRDYACDVVSVNNATGNEFSRLKLYLEMAEHDVLKGVIHELYTYLQEMAFSDVFVAEDEYSSLLEKKSRVRGFRITDRARQFFQWFYLGIMDALYRRRVMDWIVDSNITKDIKVWGAAWSRVKKFRQYHMGVARHGQQLSEIYRSSKISLCEAWAWNTHERNFEIMASGGFPLIRFIAVTDKKKKDVITNYFREDEEVVLFYNRDDLLDKIQYFIDNPDERERIAERGRNIVMRDFSHVAIARNTMECIRKYYSN